MKSVFVPHRVPRSRRPGNFLLNEARLLRIQEVHEADDYRFRPMHASISKFLFSSGLTPRSWAWAEYYEIPPLNFVMGNKSLLLSRFSNFQLQRLPSSLSRFALEGLQRGDIELKAVRAGDVYRDSRGGGEYPVTAPEVLLQSREGRPYLCAGQFPPRGPHRANFEAVLKPHAFIATSPLQLFNLIRLAKVVTIGVSSLHLFASLFGDAEEVYYPRMGHFDSYFSPRSGLTLAKLIPTGWNAM